MPLAFPFPLVSCRSWVALIVKNPAANAGDIIDLGSILGLERSPRGGRSTLLQHSCLENPMDRSLVGYSFLQILAFFKKLSKQCSSPLSYYNQNHFNQQELLYHKHKSNHSIADLYIIKQCFVLFFLNSFLVRSRFLWEQNN